MARFFSCHPVIYSRDPVKNINNIDIFSFFLDTVDKPRYDTEGVFRAMQQHTARNDDLVVIFIWRIK
ncbi:MAG: palindromic element RPE4 domain-containing protein [Rickettsia endosymbiont of Glossina mortisans submortisans]|nr:palindromic element RPE4 domain-containing protein [Rickettsia endosymbiont of Glossina mortisans submortisans]